MSFDLNILVVNQEKQSKLSFASSIVLLNEIEDDDGKRYHSIWPFMTNTKGIWYLLISSEDESTGEISICDSDFETEIKNLPVPPWIDDEDILYYLTPIVILKKYRSDFEKIINSLIQQSPNKTIMFLGRYQSKEYEIVYGVFSLNEFFSLLDKGKILFNVCYIVRDN